jgi:predicted DNA-binding transcriptional regulator AlpA
VKFPPDRFELAVPPPAERWTPTEAADFLGVSAETLRGWRSKRTGPAFFQVSRNVLFYSRSDVQSWLAQRRVRPRG